ncbi:MAG TPA: ATP-grasp domain-containing protein [Solirubrobacteraceae bacterium]|nr:ATP-grasp domain-containing protein [Solirubrobacteraceae bacterium]
MARRARRASPAGTVILDAAQRQALVAIRVLGRSGVGVVAVDGDRSAPGLGSRWCGRSVVVPHFASSADAYVDAVLAVCAESAARSLIPCLDGSVEALRPRREEVERVIGLALAREDPLDAAVDKTRTLALARTLGIRVPRGCCVSDPDVAADAIDEVGLPAVVKPARSWVQGADIGKRISPKVASSRSEALDLVLAMLRDGVDVLLQEWLGGRREALSFVYAKGRFWGRFAQRADRTFPPLGGNSVLRESISLPSDITPAAERLVAELDLEGYSEVEFRRDERGRAALMEINPRLSASVEMAVRAGVPFPRLLHDWASGESLTETSGYVTGLRMRWLGGDLSRLKSILSHPNRPDAPSRPQALMSFAADFARPAAYDYVDRGDLRPAIIATAGIARRAGRRLSRTRTPDRAG